jgi:hypothetical protein
LRLDSYLAEFFHHSIRWLGEGDNAQIDAAAVDGAGQIQETTRHTTLKSQIARYQQNAQWPALVAELIKLCGHR